MSFKIGIIGLPNVGKSTLFKALTKIKVEIADYPFTTIQPNIGIVAVPDEKLEKIGELIKPEKTIPTIIEFVDIAGLIKGAHKGEGLGNQFLAQIRNCDALVQVVKAFNKEINPKDEGDELCSSSRCASLHSACEIETIKIELEMKDLESEEKENILSKKPIIYLYNSNDQEIKFKKDEQNFLSINLKLEEEISELTENEKKELKIESKLDQLILNCYNILNLRTFYTIKGGKEVRAWTINENNHILLAAEKVHSDFREKFIKAEVINWQKLIEAGSWNRARELGWLKIKGKEYQVQSGDIIEFKI